MNIFKDNVDELARKVGYATKEFVADKQINTLRNRWNLFDEHEYDIQKLTGESLEVVLYSKYYWCTQYKVKSNKVYGADAGLDQQQYKIIEDISQRIRSVNWELLQKIEEGELH